MRFLLYLISTHVYEIISTYIILTCPGSKTSCASPLSMAKFANPGACDIWVYNSAVGLPWPREDVSCIPGLSWIPLVVLDVRITNVCRLLNVPLKRAKSPWRRISEQRASHILTSSLSFWYLAHDQKSKGMDA